MKLKFIPVVIGCALALVTQSCASLFTKSSQEVTFKGVPGTTVVNPKKNSLVAVVGDNGFGTGKVRKRLKSLDLVAQKDGYDPMDINLGTKIHHAFWFNILFGGIPGMAIDVATGKMMKYNTTFYDVTLTPSQEIAEVVIPEAPVTRNSPGTTDAEKAIIRWYFDSDPRGARVFYRIISNIPEEVKNTNETYLTTTPIEETRGFNIPGLTYENSSDVTIEIKLSKRGYEDQVKRYNVRQALDQQEISGFFEMVNK